MRVFAALLGRCVCIEYLWAMADAVHIEELRWRYIFAVGHLGIHRFLSDYVFECYCTTLGATASPHVNHEKVKSNENIRHRQRREDAPHWKTVACYTTCRKAREMEGCKCNPQRHRRGGLRSHPGPPQSSRKKCDCGERYMAHDPKQNKTKQTTRKKRNELDRD